MPASSDPWRHVIVAACAVFLFCLPSVNFSHGVLLVALTDTGLYDVSTVTWLLSVTNLMHALGGPIGSVLVNLTSCRKSVMISGLTAFLGFSLAASTSDMRIMFVSYGVLVGLARGVSISAATMSIGYWFKEDSSLASGLMYAGVGVGMLVHPRLLRALVDHYDVYGALLLMGGISFHTCICALLIRPSEFETERNRTQAEEKEKQNSTPFIRSFLKFCLHFKKSILTNYSFISFVIGMMLMMMAFQIIITFMPDFFQYHGSTPQESAMAASITGSGSLVSRVLAGIMASDPNIGTVLLFQGNCGISAIFTLLLPILAASVVGRYMYAWIIGTYLTSIFVLLGPTVLEKVGLENLSHGFGFIFLGTAVVSLVGPPLAVQVKNMTNSYYSVFVLAGCLLLGACLSGLLSEVFQRKDKGEKGCTEDTSSMAMNINDDNDDSSEEKESQNNLLTNESEKTMYFTETNV